MSPTCLALSCIKIVHVRLHEALRVLSSLQQAPVPSALQHQVELLLPGLPCHYPAVMAALHQYLFVALLRRIC